MKKLIVPVALLFCSIGVHAQDFGAATLQPPPPPPPPAPGMVMRAPFESKVVKDAPYSADLVIESTQTLSDGNRIVQRTTGRVYRDTEGRVRREEDRASGFPSVSIADPVAGVSYSLDTEHRIAWKSMLLTTDIVKRLEATKVELGDKVRRREPTPANPAAADAEAEARRQADRSKVEAAGAMLGGRGPVRRNEQHTEETLATRQIENVRAEGVRTTTVIPAGEIGNVMPIKVVSEEWTSPELKVLVLTQHSDPRTGESSYRLLNVIRGEPNPSFFQVPPDYTVRETGIRRFERRQ